MDIEPEPSVYYPCYVDEVIEQLIEEVHQDGTVRCEGTGGSMPFDILSVDMSFFSDRCGTVAEAQVHLVGLIEKFKQIINKHEKIRPFLRDYPFLPNRMDFSLRFRTTCTKANPSPELHVDYASCVGGIIRYKQVDIGTNRYVTIKEEPYEEARSIVQRSQI